MNYELRHIRMLYEDLGNSTVQMWVDKDWLPCDLEEVGPLRRVFKFSFNQIVLVGILRQLSSLGLMRGPSDIIFYLDERTTCTLKESFLLLRHLESAQFQVILVGKPRQEKAQKSLFVDKRTKRGASTKVEFFMEPYTMDAGANILRLIGREGPESFVLINVASIYEYTRKRLRQ